MTVERNLELTYEGLKYSKRAINNGNWTDLELTYEGLKFCCNLSKSY